MQTVKIVFKTLSVVFIAVFLTLTWIGYVENSEQRIKKVKPILPDFEHDTNQAFLDDVKKCVKYVYYHNDDIVKVNLELLLAQAALESAWGTSRFAKEGHNLFGIRTYDLREPHMLPSNKARKWGVRVYKHECDSVKHYMNILNNGSAYERYRKVRDSGVNDSIILLNTLDAYASDKNYFPKVRDIILKIRKEYN